MGRKKCNTETKDEGNAENGGGREKGPETVKALFWRTYVGRHGTFYAGWEYKLAKRLYEELSYFCKAVK